MYVVDTNVISELRKTRQGRADNQVVAWVGTIPRHRLFLSAISLMELELGVLLTERRDAKHGKALRHWITQDVKPSFAERILPVDETVAIMCAALHASGRKPDRDAFIAATALVHRMTVATRNEKDFAATGVKVVNPWNFTASV